VTVSIVIPVYRDAAALASTISEIEFADAQVIVAATADDREALRQLQLSAPHFCWIESPRGRAHQMNAGAAAATGDWLVFLHADTRLPPNWRDAIADAARDPRVTLGCFRFALDSPSICARIVEVGVRLRVRLFGLPYGDQALFVRRRDFAAAGGYADLPIMEDVDLVRRLRSTGRLYRAPYPAVTSARKWQRDGWIRRTTIHLRLITLYFLGVSPQRLAKSVSKI
jgi:rSAM/selenodomain-associated transferase 2